MRLICALRDKSFRICFNFDVSLKRAVLSVTEKDIKFVVEPIAKKLFSVSGLNISADTQQHLALYSNELLPNSIKSCQSRFTISPNIK